MNGFGLAGVALAATGVVLALSGSGARRPDLRALAALARGPVDGAAGPVGTPASPTAEGPGPPGSARSRGAVLRAVAAAGAAGAVLLLVPGIAGLAGAPLAAAVVWWRGEGWETAAERRRRARLEDDLPHVVDLMVAGLAAGADPGHALERIAAAVPGPTGRELVGWVARLKLGADPAGVWSAMAGHPQLGRLGVVLRRSAESGAPVGPALARLAEDLLERRRSEVEARVRQVEVKATVPLGLCLLPAFVLLGVVPLVAGAALGFLGTP